jgi:hypothetical protein
MAWVALHAQTVKMRKLLTTAIAATFLLACSKQDLKEQGFDQKTGMFIQESSMFEEVGSLDIGGTGAAEISAFDELTKRLFVVNNTDGNNRIDVIDLSDPSMPSYLSSISVAPFGGLVNSVAVSDGKLAAAIEASNKQMPGKVVVFRTNDNAVLSQVTVGPLPDMVTFSPDGEFILTANEGEPSGDYSNDPVGSVSIISVKDGYDVTTLDFSGFEGQQAALMAKGLRIFGPGASFAQDIEPEYVTVSANSQKAWVSLQENNAIARIDIKARRIEEIMPLGFKDYSLMENAIDPSERDGKVEFRAVPAFGMYLPDALAVVPQGNVPFIFSANEGDAREYDEFDEQTRVGSVTLDPTAFPNGDALKTNANLGRLRITNTMGDTDGDGDYDKLYSFGARSFSIWNGLTGEQVFDSRNEVDQLAKQYGFYPINSANGQDDRSDDKACEPEGLTIGRVGNRNLMFLGLERSDAVLIYDVNNPARPVFLQYLLTGDAPEGVLFIDAEKSPTGRSLLVVSSEEDGKIKVYTTL